MNDWLINALGVHDVSCYDEFQVGKMALLNQPCMTSELVKKVKDTFNVPVRLAGKEVEIKTIAICNLGITVKEANSQDYYSYY